MDKMNKDVKRMFELGNMKRTTKKATVVGLTGLILMGNIPQVNAASRYDASNYRGKGYISKVEEVSAEGDGGYISSGKGDYGGVSYGIYQFSTVTGSAKGFVKWTKDNYPEVYKYFQDEGTTTPNTKAFNRAWTKCYNEMGMKFEKAQYDYAYKELINPAYKNVKEGYGVDLRTSRAREEYLISTAIQFGPGGICDLMDHVNVNNNMDDDELLSTLCNEKYRSVGRYKFNGCSSEVRVYARQRFIREKAELKKIAKEESGPLLDEISSDGTSEETTKTEVKSTSTTKTSTKEAKNEVVKEAISKYTDKDISYKMGAKDPSSGKLDCSGFVSKIANDMGADIDSYYTNAAKLSSMSKKIDKSDLQAGDLVFWHDLAGTRHNYIYHIGIYNGDGTITDCSPSHGGIGTRKLSECTNVSGDKYFTFGRLDSISDNVEKEAKKIVKESKEETKDSKTTEDKTKEDKQETVQVASSEFDDVISTDDKEIEDKADKVEEELASVKEGITGSSSLEDASEDGTDYDEFDSVIADNNTKEETKVEDKQDKESTKEEVKDNTESKEETKTEENDNKDKETTDTKDKEESKDTTKEEDKSETKDNSEGLDGQLVIGDSHMEMSKDKIENNYDGAQVEAKTGSSAYVWLHNTKYWGEALLDKLPEDSDDIKGVVVSLGINNIDGITNESDVVKVLEKLQAKYPGKSIKIMKVNPVGDKYNEGSVSETNKKVDSLNKVIKDYAAKHKDVYMVDVSKGLVKDGKLSKTNDGLHTNNPSKLVDNLNEAVKKADQENKDVTTEDKSTTKEDTTKKDTKEESKVEDKRDKESSKEETKDVKQKDTKDTTKKETKTEDKTKEDTSKEESKDTKDEKKTESKVEDKQDKEYTKEEVKDNTESKKETSKDIEETKQEDTTKEEKDTVEKDNANDNKVEEDKNETDTKEESSKEDNSVESTKEETNDTQESDDTKQSQETDTKSDGDQEVEQLQSKLKSNLFGKIFLG